MKCVILCGGKGTRLREETEFRPKPLVEIGGRPIIWHIMKHYAHYSVNDFILTLGYKGEMIKRYFVDYQWINEDITVNLRDKSMEVHSTANQLDDWKVTCAETGLESLTGLRLFLVRKYLEGEEDFCLTYGDGVSTVNIKDVIALHMKSGKIITITGVHPRSKYGLFYTDETGKVKNFQEKPILPDIINGGFMVINRKIFNYFSATNNIMIEQVIEQLTKERELNIYVFDGFWHSMDTYQDYESLNKIWAENAAWKVWK